jgi:hypothetical protein
MATRYLRINNSQWTPEVQAATIHETELSVFEGVANRDERIITFVGDKILPLHGMTEITENQFKQLIRSDEFSMPYETRHSELNNFSDELLIWWGYTQEYIDNKIRTS